ncbi:MAG TPA: RagB/SusD family nutrient uptake outer membrane protein [Sphingobacteriaceae bacterium]|nr:RagB/SusD family nutrient uptake outer membrane protein [Sphingobacteriaceae bacterium]
MKNIKYIILTLVIIFTSCKKFLEETPYSFKSPSNLLQSEEAANAFIIGVYDRLSAPNPFASSFRQGLLIVANFGTDDFSGKGAANQLYGDFMNYTFNATNNNLDLIWNNFYSGINQASGIINNIPTAPLKDATKTKIAAEAKFLRALFYFYLVRMHGGVPLVTKETTSLEDLNTKRASIQEVYQLIIKDLTEAAPSLPEAAATVPGRATRGAALALLTKVYLTMGSYGKYKSVAGYEWVNTTEAFKQAVNEGNKVLSISDYKLVSDYGSIFNPETENGPEIIYSVQMAGDATISDEGSFLANLFAPASIGNMDVSRGGQNHARPTRNLINKYAATDIIKAWNIANFGYNGCIEVLQNQSYAAKFRKPCGYNGQHFSTSINFPLLRLADVMLMVAEAEVEANGGVSAPNAIILVNKLGAIRHSIPPPSPMGNILDFIFDERSRELAYEGQRWFDLVRTGRLINAVKSTVLSTATTSAPANIKPIHYLYPIPQNEIDNNSAINNSDQNPGY